MFNEPKTVLIIVIGMILSTGMLQAQSLEAYITIDPDGYTNVREQPSASSKITGKVCKYDVFFSVADFCGNDLHATDKWEPVSGNGVFGYIYTYWRRGWRKWIWSLVYHSEW